MLPITSSSYHAHAARRDDPGKLPADARSASALKVEIHGCMGRTSTSTADGRSGDSSAEKGLQWLAASSRGQIAWTAIINRSSAISSSSIAAHR